MRADLAEVDEAGPLSAIRARIDEARGMILRGDATAAGQILAALLDDLDIQIHIRRI